MLYEREIIANYSFEVVKLAMIQESFRVELTSS